MRNRVLADHVRYLVSLTELELIDRERSVVERRIRQASFPAVKSLDSFDFKAIASLNKMLVLDVDRDANTWNVVRLSVFGRQKRNPQDPYRPRSRTGTLPKGALRRLRLTAAALVHDLMEARDEKRLYAPAESDWQTASDGSGHLGNCGLMTALEDRDARAAVIECLQPELRAILHPDDLLLARSMSGRRYSKLGTPDRVYCWTASG